jgi:hypothetical protein
MKKLVLIGVRIKSKPQKTKINVHGRPFEMIGSLKENGVVKTKKG